MSFGNDLLVEKYRPIELTDVKGQNKVVSALDIYIKRGTFPHLIFSGPAGTGKTTCAMILANKVCGIGNTLIVNASLENSIQFVRDVLRQFAETYGEHPNIIKVVILDEADNMSPPAQQGLRKTMEYYSENCRFILNCNYGHKIIDPIFSRCVLHKFSRISNSDVFKRLNEICLKEKIDISRNDIKKIVLYFSGDLRRSINILNSIKLGVGVDSLLVSINPMTFIKLVLDNNIRGIRDYIDKSVYGNRDLKDLISRCIKYIVNNDGKIIEKYNVDSKTLKRLLLVFAEGDYRVTVGTDYYTIAFWICLKFNSLEE